MAGDGVEQLGEGGGIEIARALLDHSQPQVDVAEQASFLGLPESRPGSELADAADVVEECGGQDEVGAKSRVELCRLATERGDADGVLEESAAVAVVPVRARGWKRAHPLPDLFVPDERADDRREPVMRDLRGEVLEEAIELVGVTPQGRGELDRVGVRSLHRAHLHLQLPAEPLDAPEYAHGVPFGEPRVQELDVVPDTRLDTPARVDELEREVRRARPGSSTLLLRDREHALDGAILDELGDRGHVPTI